MVDNNVRKTNKNRSCENRNAVVGFIDLLKAEGSFIDYTKQFKEELSSIESDVLGENPKN